MNVVNRGKRFPQFADILTVHRSLQFFINFLYLENTSTAFLISNEITAIASLNVFQDVRISIPNDISVIAFGHSDFFRNTRPSLTTVSYDIEWSGSQMVDQLIKRINGEMLTPIVIKKPELVIRESTKKLK